MSSQDTEDYIKTTPELSDCNMILFTGAVCPVEKVCFLYAYFLFGCYYVICDWLGTGSYV